MPNTIEEFTPRPYARLYMMIGDQLIRNQRIALIELIKNSYDADASWVQIRFKNFQKIGDTLKFNKKSIIEIEDDGCGMTYDIIKNVWMNPATPYKYLKRKRGLDKTHRGRIIQGEKGIGRFAIFKLGRKIDIITRAEEKGSKELVITTDLSNFDDELIDKKNNEYKKMIFLDQLKISCETREKPLTIIAKEINIKDQIIERQPHGTLIKISDLKNDWAMNEINGILIECLKMISPFKHSINIPLISFIAQSLGY